MECYKLYFYLKLKTSFEPHFKECLHKTHLKFNILINFNQLLVFYLYQFTDFVYRMITAHFDL